MAPLNTDALEKVARAATENLAAPEWQGDDNGYIWGQSLKGGATPIAQVRGWGYLTGHGSGALGLSAPLAVAAQAAWEAHIATFDPPTVLRLLAERRAMVEALQKADSELSMIQGCIAGIAQDFDRFNGSSKKLGGPAIRALTSIQDRIALRIAKCAEDARAALKLSGAE